MKAEILYKKLFKYGELSEFARFAKMDKQVVRARFQVKGNVLEDVLRKYAAWKHIPDVEAFVAWCYGPAPVKTDVMEPAMLSEPLHTYGSGNGVVPGMIQLQKEQNIALMKLANAAEINSLTIATMIGVPRADLEKILNRKLE